MHPSNKFQRKLVKEKHEKKVKDRSGHVKRILLKQAVKEQESANEIREAIAVSPRGKANYDPRVS